jgi:hypothetical protein
MTPRAPSKTLRLVGCMLLVLGALLLLTRWLNPKTTTTQHASIAQEDVASPARRTLDLRAPPRSAGLSGVVRKADMAPLPAARVCATCASCDISGQGDQLCTDANGAGEYLLSSLGVHGYLVTASAPGFAITAANDGKPIYIEPNARREGVDIVLGDRGYDVVGRVRDALGGPIAAASVRLVSWGDATLSTSVLSDADGRFKASLGAQRLTAIASAPGYSPARTYHVAPTQDLELVLTPEVSIAGKVLTDGDKRPVAGAQILARSIDQGMAGSGEAISAEDGTFRITGLDPGRYVLNATARGYRSIASEVYELSLGQAQTGAWVLVEPAAQVSGRVVIEESGAMRPCERGYAELGMAHPAISLRDPKWTEAAIAALPSPPASVIALIGAGGVVRFDAVPPGTYFASVECEDHYQHAGPDVVQVTLDDVEDLAWRVIPASKLSIRVVDERERPVPSADVQIEWPTGTLSTVTAGPDGWTPPVTHLYPGIYKLDAEDGLQAETVALEIKAGVPDVRGTVRVKGDATLEVEVQDHSGRALDDVQVVAGECRSVDAPSGSDAVAPTNPRRPRWTSVPLGLGRFRIGPVAAGCFRVEVNDAIHPRMQEVAGDEIRVAAGQHVTHRVTLNREAMIEGQVLAEDGSPLPDVWVGAQSIGNFADRLAVASLRTNTYAAMRVITDSDGRFRIAALERKRDYDLTVEAANGVSTLCRGVAAGARVTIKMPEAGMIEGTVTRDGGQPVDEFRIEVIETETQRAAGREFARTSGRFALTGITPGKLRVLVVDPTGQTAQLETELRSGQRLAGLHLSISNQVVNATAVEGAL